MTGLDPVQDRIIEIATIVTDANLTTLEEGPNLVVYQSLERLEAMDEWNQTHHGNSGLIKLVKESPYTERMAERATLEFLRKLVSKGQSPMCGNSVCQDRQFLRLYMPELHNYFHYRSIDVSTLKELHKRWNPQDNQFTKLGNHRALDDIKESIAELDFYRQKFFICD
tara:strand:- start:151 stop:654 length:504 start_codon:yes stop_codon:yes gene_type:complete